MLRMIYAVVFLGLFSNSCAPSMMRSCKVMCHPYGVAKYDSTMDVCQCNKVQTLRRIIED